MSDLISYQMQYIQEFTSAIRKAKRIMKEAEHDMRHTSDVQAQKFADLIEQQQQRIVELERKLRLEEELHHVTESGYTELFTTIEEQQQQIKGLEAQLPRWISVEDELPPIDTWVLWLDGNKTMAPYHSDYHIDKIDKRGECIVNYTHNYTHWMPLPQQQKEKDDE